MIMVSSGCRNEKKYDKFEKNLECSSVKTWFNVRVKERQET